MFSKPIRALGVLGGAAALAVGPLAAPAAAAPGDVQLLFVNDFHGRITTSDGAPLASHLAGAIDQLTAEAAGYETRFVSAGDNVGASIFQSAVAEDAPTIDILNEMGLLTAAVGNHEFDRGYDWLADPATHGIDAAARVEGGPPATWSTLAANVEGESPEMDEYVIETINGIDVGFVGVTTTKTPAAVDPAGVQGITWTDPTVAANRVASDITASGEADIVVVLAHFGPSGAPTDGTSACPTAPGDFGGLVAGANDDIDLILSGDTHIQVNCLAANGAPVLMAQQYAEAIGRVQLQVDPESNEVTIVEAEILPIFDDEGAPLYPSDPEVEAIAQAAAEDADVLGAVPVGEITDDITRAFDADGNEDRGAESAAGNLIADAQLAATSSEGTGGAQCAFMNAGGIRADFDLAASGNEGDGVVTYAEAATVQPFANGVVTITLTGEQVKSVLEEQWQPEGAGRPVLWLGVSDGFEFYYEADAARGERITGIFLDGEAIDPAAEYRVTVNSFLANGGDNFATLVEGTDRFDTGLNDLNVLVEYFDAASPIDAASLTPRSFVGQPPSDPTPTPTPSPAPPGDDDDDDGDGRNPGFGVDTGRTGADGSDGIAGIGTLGTLGAFGGLALLLAVGGYAVRRRTSGAAR